MADAVYYRLAVYYTFLACKWKREGTSEQSSTQTRKKRSWSGEYTRARRWEDARWRRKGFRLGRRGMRGRGRRGVEADAHRAPAVNVDYAHPWFVCARPYMKRTLDLAFPKKRIEKFRSRTTGNFSLIYFQTGQLPELKLPKNSARIPHLLREHGFTNGSLTSNELLERLEE